MASLLNRPSGASRPEWQKFLRQCLLQRISTNEFHNLAKVMLRRHPISHKDLFDVVLESRAVTNFDWDPLIPDYVDAVQKLTQVELFNILPTLLAHSSIKSDVRRWKERNQAQNQDTDQKVDGKGSMKPAGSKGPVTLLTDYGIIQNVITAVTTGHAPKIALEFMDTCSAIADWILALVSWNAHLGSEKGEGSGTQLLATPDVVSIFIAVGFLFGALAGTEVGANALSFQHAGSKFLRVSTCNSYP